MKLPDIQYRRAIYKIVVAAIPVVGTLAAGGLIAATPALIIASVLGFLGNLLADRASNQLQKDGTLILTGSVEKQVIDGINILAGKAADSVSGIEHVNEALAKANKARDEVVTTVSSTPVLGPLAAEALDRILNHK